MPPPYYESVPMQAWGSGAAMPPPPPTYCPPTFVVPNEAFVAPYASMPQPQQSAAIIGAYMQRNKQDVERSEAMSTIGMKEQQESPINWGVFKSCHRINSMEGLCNNTLSKDSMKANQRSKDNQMKNEEGRKGRSF